MSLADRLTKLEALAFANTQKIEELSTQNTLLANQNAQQEETIAKYELDFGIDSASEAHIFQQESLATRSGGTYEPFFHRQLQSRGRGVYGHLPTPFYLVSRGARHLQLAFVVPGMMGETLDFQVERMDLVFILEQILERKRWSDENIYRAVEDFLERPMVRVLWRGREGELGMLD